MTPKQLRRTTALVAVGVLGLAGAVRPLAQLVMSMIDANRSTKRRHENTKTRNDRVWLSCFRAFVAILMLLGGRATAFAELDLSGMWANRLHEDFMSRAPGPRIGDYMGIPLNDECRARADAWQISIQTMPERQCILYTSQCIVMGPQSFKMLPEVHPHQKRQLPVRSCRSRAPGALRAAGGDPAQGRRGSALPASTNPFVDEMAKLYGIPLEAVRGGAATMYPEFRKKVKDAYKQPEKCERDCGNVPPAPVAPATPAGLTHLPAAGTPNR